MTNKGSLFAILIGLSIILSSCNNSEQTNSNSSSNKKTFTLKDYRKLNKLHTKLGKPQPGDWLFSKNEKGQPYKEYIKSSPIVPTEKRNKIYILPIGQFNIFEKFVLNETAEFMHLFFNLDVIIEDTKPTSIIPSSAKRYNYGIQQLHTKHILHKTLRKNIPNNATVYIAITSDDLYPADDWNFVFGQASIKKRVGVSSIARLTYSNIDTSNYHLFLKRIAETTTHETCHMFSMRHCKDYKCMMNGSMHLEEADSKPLHLCSECLAKLNWCTNQEAIERYDKLIKFFNKHNFNEEVTFCEKSKDLLLSLR